MRLDTYLAKAYPTLSRSTIQRLIQAGKVTVNNAIISKPAYTVSQDQTISLEQPKPADFSATIRDFRQYILYENKHVIVVNKPAGLLTHAKGTLCNEFTLADFAKANFNPAELDPTNNRLGIVHRLDRDTSGVIILARDLATMHYLQAQFSQRKTKKTYLALVSRAPKQPAATINLPLARNPKKPASFMVTAHGKPAITDYRTLEKFANGMALLELKPHTGRTHQLRVHLNYINAPIVGDRLYNATSTAKRMYLHAQTLEITIPTDNGNTRMTFQAPLPSDFEAAIQHVR